MHSCVQLVLGVGVLIICLGALIIVRRISLSMAEDADRGDTSQGSGEAAADGESPPDDPVDELDGVELLPPAV